MFGAGTVRTVAGAGPEAKITVDFSPSVGQKKLLASVANLRVADGAGDGAPPRSGATAWYEILDVQLEARPNRRPNREMLTVEINRALRQAEFWIVVRERIRGRGIAPKVLDEVSGNLSCSVSGLLRLKIVVRHSELVRPETTLLAQVILDEMSLRLFNEFQTPRMAKRVDTEHGLIDADVITLEDAAIENLPDRQMRQRPKPVTPKGVIKSLPKRRDDY